MFNKNYRDFAVLGLGRFGMSIVSTLAEADVNILACDEDETKLAQATDYATHVIQVDLADEHALEKLGLGNFDVVILAIGEDFETSLTAAMIAKEQGAKQVIVKARNKRQKTILQSIGVDLVVLPEHEMGAKLARRLTGSNIIDILQESDSHSITEIRPKKEWIGKTVSQADLRRKEQLTVIAIRSGHHLQVPVKADTLIGDDDILLVFREID